MAGLLFVWVKNVFPSWQFPAYGDLNDAFNIYIMQQRVIFLKRNLFVCEQVLQIAAGTDLGSK